ncbi:exodeoxyribonuclease III [Pararhodobacter sp. SW119]|uniref:exodeoxyribonuclease III n=1 Tax=Pararhodobacter sp. SW119 TaxID=2780075 RepID=UPI001ADEE3E0|nr:exodeoxyribonuclease III [Pararhodobacter sp. SW119]
MKIATFNINGIKARASVLARWLDESAPDMAVLQEIKSTDATFPRELIESRGYHLALHGQKGFNGVAILSKRPLSDVRLGLPGDDEDAQARWIEARDSESGLRLCGLYLPNGNPAPGPKFDYKLAWLKRLLARARVLLTEEAPLVLAGDWNVIPQPIDAARPQAWRDDALFLPESRAAFRRIEALGFYDALRLRHPRPGQYTFWDYQAGARHRNDGIRIDHLLLSPQAADRLSNSWIETEPRDWEKPSDHTPVWITLDL